MKKSPIDELFFELYGYYPNKAGQAYEMIVAAAFKFLLDKEIDYDQRLRGDFSETIYQLDGVVNDDATGKKMIEAKDYTINDKKVGRGDLQKLQGALSDLPIESGIFVSATNFTKPASKYADSAENNPMHKEIELFDVRPSTDADEKGRIKKITFNISMHVIDYEKGKYQPIFTKNGYEKIMTNDLSNKPMTMKLEEFYDENRNVILTLLELTKNHPPGTNCKEDDVAKGCWIVDGYFDIEDILYEIKGIQYEIPFAISRSEMVVEGDGNPKIYIKSHSGSIDKLITDEQLKKVKFENGKVIIS